ncbi:MAG: hypothetical protein ACTHJR_11635 [Sphingomonas sp.]|uniref:hypothetical protein n=1 Tax=Sphingomonas sp. TaxID=28214 RepID=UPI003F7F9449
MTGVIDQFARDQARDANAALERHEAECAQRYQRLDEGLDRVEGIIKWAGGLIVTLIISVLGWALVQQWNANEAQKRDLQQKIEMMQEAQRVQPIIQAAPSPVPSPAPAR